MNIFEPEFFIFFSLIFFVVLAIVMAKWHQTTIETKSIDTHTLKRYLKIAIPIAILAGAIYGLFFVRLGVFHNSENNWLQRIFIDLSIIAINGIWWGGY